MTKEFFDAKDTLAHDEFQAWRTSHQDGVFLNFTNRTRANLHGARCPHLGSGPPYFSSDDGFGSLTAKRKLCGSESELLAWATANGVAVTACHDCERDGLVRAGNQGDHGFGEAYNSSGPAVAVPADPSDSLEHRLNLAPRLAAAILRIFATSAQVVHELRPEWFYLHMDGRRLRLLLGRLIVMTIEGNYVWLATDPDMPPADLVSWHLDRPGVRPSDAKGKAYPEYKTPRSINGFYAPADDPSGVEWQSLRSSHISYLKRAAVTGHAPDHRTVHDAALQAEVFAWLDSEPAERAFYEQVRRARDLNSESRHARLKVATNRPAARIIEVRVFERNPDVVAEVLCRANGRCECCGNEAPFRRTSDGTPYLEVHHRTRLADGGDDTVDNAVALCPNCHRRQHYG